jgi:hypothetical protein
MLRMGRRMPNFDMALHLAHRWHRLHWFSRVSMFAVLASLLWWVTRTESGMYDAMFGWPLAFHNIWYSGIDTFRMIILILDIAVWLFLAGSVGYVSESWRRKPNRRQFSLAGLVCFQTAAAALVSLGFWMLNLQAHPNDFWLVPPFVRLDMGFTVVWLDIGLFTEPPSSPLWDRTIILVAIGCSFYSAAWMLMSILRHFLNVKTKRTAAEPPASSTIIQAIASENSPDPLIVRIMLWLLFLLFGLSLLWKCIPVVY